MSASVIVQLRGFSSMWALKLSLTILVKWNLFTFQFVTNVEKLQCFMYFKGQFFIAFTCPSQNIFIPLWHFSLLKHYCILYENRNLVINNMTIESFMLSLKFQPRWSKYLIYVEFELFNLWGLLSTSCTVYCLAFSTKSNQ